MTRPTSESGEETRASLHRLQLKERITRRCGGDLDCIVMKCLEKDRVRRYETANGLATDIQRYLSHEPIIARPPNAAYKIRKTWQRNKLACAAAAAVALALIAGTGVSTWQTIQATKARDIARKANVAEKEQRLAAQTAQKQAESAQQAEKEARRQANHELYVAKLNLAQEAWDQDNIGRLRQLLEETATNAERGFEWYYWQRQAHLEIKDSPRSQRRNQLEKVAFSPDGKRIVSGSWDQTAKKSGIRPRATKLITLKGTWRCDRICGLLPGRPADRHG